MLSLHALGNCYFVEQITIDVPTMSQNNKSQPYIVIIGKANEIEIKLSMNCMLAQIR